MKRGGRRVDVWELRARWQLVGKMAATGPVGLTRSPRPRWNVLARARTDSLGRARCLRPVEAVYARTGGRCWRPEREQNRRLRCARCPCAACAGRAASRPPGAEGAPRRRRRHVHHSFDGDVGPCASSAGGGVGGAGAGCAACRLMAVEGARPKSAGRSRSCARAGGKVAGQDSNGRRAGRRVGRTYEFCADQSGRREGGSARSSERELASRGESVEGGHAPPTAMTRILAR